MDKYDMLAMAIVLAQVKNGKLATAGKGNIKDPFYWRSRGDCAAVLNAYHGLDYEVAKVGKDGWAWFPYINGLLTVRAGQDLGWDGVPWYQYQSEWVYVFNAFHVGPQLFAFDKFPAKDYNYLGVLANFTLEGVAVKVDCSSNRAVPVIAGCPVSDNWPRYQKVFDETKKQFPDKQDMWIERKALANYRDAFPDVPRELLDMVMTRDIGNQFRMEKAAKKKPRRNRAKEKLQQVLGL